MTFCKKQIAEFKGKGRSIITWRKNLKPSQIKAVLKVISKTCFYGVLIPVCFSCFTLGQNIEDGNYTISIVIFVACSLLISGGFLAGYFEGKSDACEKER